jgi:hypothetical protein
MARRKRWDGEFLVEVREDGSVLLPIFDFDSSRPTHYRVAKHHTDGGLILIPMKVARPEDLQPSEPEPPKPEFVQRPYTEDELESLNFVCPFCNQPVGHGCVSRPSGKLLIDYPAGDGKALVHAKRLEKLREQRQLERSINGAD